jgi:endonuclease G
MNKLVHIIASAMIALVISTPAFALNNDFAQCKQLFADGKAPVIAVVDMQLRALCFSNFAVMHSGASRTPFYVAERLNKTLLNAAHLKRGDKFFADARLPRAERAELADYKGSGYDRGHMAPAANMATADSMAQSFSLANMVPQAPINNRQAWAKIEKATRQYIKRAAGDVYVITGPIFELNPVTIGSNQVWVPRYIYKLVYDPQAQKLWAHWIENSDTAQLGKPISYAELVQRTGIHFFPDLK